MRQISISDSSDDLMTDNYRPPCSQGSRVVRRSCMKAKKSTTSNISNKPQVEPSSSNKSSEPQNTPLSNQSLYVFGGCALGLAVTIPIVLYLKRKL